MPPTTQLGRLAPETSQRIEALRFLLAIAIVVIHANGFREEIGERELGPESIGPAAGFVQELLSGVIARTAVPLFFLFSGFLTATSLHRHGYLGLLRKRLRTLLVPFLLWNALVFSLFCILSPDKLSTANPLHIFGVTTIPASYQFWFIRDLIVLVLLAPLFVLIARFAPALSIIAGLSLWFVAPGWLGVGGAPLDPAAICFFQIGITLCWNPVKITPAPFRVAAVAYLPLAVIDASFSNDSTGGFLAHKAVLLVGIAAVWQAGGWLIKSHPLPTALTGSAFLVFAAHEPLLGMLKKASYYFIQPGGDLSVTAIYVLAAAATVLSCLLAHFFISKYLPRTYALVTGGR